MRIRSARPPLEEVAMRNRFAGIAALVVLAGAGTLAVSRAQDAPPRIQVVAGAGQGSWGIQHLANGRVRFYQRSVRYTDQTEVWIPVFEASAGDLRPPPPTPATPTAAERDAINRYRADPKGRFTLEEHAAIERHRQATRIQQATRTDTIPVQVTR
jgi:hypothetical protein